MWSRFSWIELPLLRRELLEASHKRRTYVLRTLIAVIHVVGFLLYYFSVYSRRGSIRRFSGEGVDAVYIHNWRTSFDYIVHHSRNRAWGYLPLNLVFSLLHAFVYLTIMKWWAVGLSLMFRTQMKAMMATLVAAISLCALPFVGAMIPLVLQSIVPKEFPAFLFSSPLIIWGLNETGELQDLVPASSFPGVMEGKWTSFQHDPALQVIKRNGISQGTLVSINLLIYGTMALVLKYGVLLLLPKILGRRDADVS